MPKVNITETIHIGGKVFFKGEAFVSEDDAKMLKHADPTLNLSDPTNTANGTIFPADYPGFDVLGQIEGMTPEKLANMSDDEITAINGIGKKTLAEIRAYGK